MKLEVGADKVLFGVLCDAEQKTGGVGRNLDAVKAVKHGLVRQSKVACGEGEEPAGQGFRHAHLKRYRSKTKVVWNI